MTTIVAILFFAGLARIYITRNEESESQWHPRYIEWEVLK